MSVVLESSDPKPLPPNPEQLRMLMTGERGAGEVLKLCREARGWHQSDLAKRLNVTRSAVATWETDRRWPRGINLDKLLIAISPKTMIAEDSRLQGRVTNQELGTLLHELEMAGKDELDRADALITYAYPRVLSTLILRATAAPGVNADAKSIQLFFEHRKEIREEKRLRTQVDAKNVTPRQADWIANKGVLKPAEKVKAIEPDERATSEAVESSEEPSK